MDTHQQDENKITENTSQPDQPISEQNIHQDNEDIPEQSLTTEETLDEFEEDIPEQSLTTEEILDEFDEEIIEEDSDDEEDSELDRMYLNYRNYLAQRRYNLYNVFEEESDESGSEFENPNSLVNMLLSIHANNVYAYTIMENRDQYLLNNVLNRSLEDDIRYTNVDMDRELEVEEKEYGENKTEEKCMICLETFEEKDIVGNIDCNHVFHINCLQEWGKRNPKCPLCKKDIPILTQERKRQRTE